MARCKPHALTHILQGHSDAVIALGSKYMQEYNIVDPTKCLNSAVSLLFLLLGSQDALKNTRHCDVGAVRDRYLKHDLSADAAKALASDLRATRADSSRIVFYCMITDAWLTSKDNPGVEKYFPGHVFVIERCGRTFSVFQSYIKQYDLDKYLAQMHVYDDKMLDDVAKGVEMLFTKPVWDRAITEFWRRFTLTDSDGFEGFELRGKVLFCYRSIPLADCVGSLQRIVAEQLRFLKTQNGDDIYHGQLSNATMMRHLQAMLHAMAGV